MYVCVIYNLCYLYDTLCFVGNVLFVIQNMCLMNTSKKEPKKLKKNNQFLLLFYPKNGVQFTILRTGLPVISTDLPVILAGKLVGTGF
jgi:hypothetical protein